MGRSGLKGVLGLPTDARGIVLACGSLALSLYGLALLLGADALGLIYLAAGLASYLFLHVRVLPMLVWLGVAAAGLLALGNEPAAIVLVVVGAGLAAVSVWRPSHESAPASAPEPISARPVSEPAVAPAPAEVLAAVPAPEALLGIAADASPHAASAAAEQEAAPLIAIAPPDEAGPEVRVETIGRFRVLADSEDLSEALGRKRIVQFAWTLLMVRALLGYPAISREELGDELAPGLSIRTQRSRVRRQIWDVLNDLPPQLALAVKTDRRQVSFDLSAICVDVEELRELALRVADHGGLIPAVLAKEVESRLSSLSPGTFLPNFDPLVKDLNLKDKGTAGDLVDEVRREVLRLRGDLALALAKRATAAADFSAVVRHLEPAALQDPDREDLAERLITAYVRTGQTPKANQLRRRLDAAQEG